MYQGHSVDAELITDDGACVLTHSPLDTKAIIDSVGCDEAGATAVFIGTTRNSFRGKSVHRLEYQAYSKLALKTMASIVQQARINSTSNTSDITSSSPSTPISTPQATLSPDRVLKTAVHHRLGQVPVGSPSIVIAVSSPHRLAAFTACEYILEQVKARAQIWKREFYVGEEDDSAVWKEN